MKHLFSHLWRGSLLMIILSLLSGCVSDTEVLKKQTADTPYRIGQKILDSIRKKDYVQFSRTLARYGGPVPAEEEYRRTEKEFSAQFGTIVSFRYLTELQTPGVCNLLWTVALERQSLRHKGEVIRQELLFRLVTAGKNNTGKLQILGMGFF